MQQERLHAGRQHRHDTAREVMRMRAAQGLR
jgi:hypothetical protein